MALNDKQQKFVNEYLLCANATQAAKKAGYAENTAYSQGQRLLKHVEVRSALMDAKADVREKAKVDAAWVLNELHAMWEADLGDIINDAGMVKPIQDWPDAWKKQLNGFEMAELYDRSDGQPMQVGDLKKIKWIAREKVLDMIARHIDVQAFSERSTVEVVDKASILEKARQRAKSGD